MTDANETNKRIEIRDFDGKVVLDICGQETVFEPHTAVQIAQSLIDCATYCGVHVEVQVERRPFTSQQRVMLVKRVEHIMRSMKLNKAPPERVAIEVVDTVLAEAL